jgi:hypothetical protein
VERYFVEDVLWDGEPFDAEGFEVDFTACDAAAKLFATFSLEVLHYKGGGADDYDEDTNDDEEEDPEGG